MIGLLAGPFSGGANRFGRIVLRPRALAFFSMVLTATSFPVERRAEQAEAPMALRADADAQRSQADLHRRVSCFLRAQSVFFSPIR